VRAFATISSSRSWGPPTRRARHAQPTNGLQQPFDPVLDGRVAVPGEQARRLPVADQRNADGIPLAQVTFAGGTLVGSEDRPIPPTCIDCTARNGQVPYMIDIPAGETNPGECWARRRFPPVSQPFGGPHRSHTTVGSIPSHNTHAVDVSTGRGTHGRSSRDRARPRDPLRCNMSRHHRSLSGPRHECGSV